MINLLTAGLMLGMTAAVSSATVVHETRIDHHTGPVHVRYNGAVMIEHKQIGTVAPGGRPSTLRCAWQANMAVTREAKATPGTLMTRQFVREDIASGSRAGWCSSNKAAIAKEVAARTTELDRQIIEVAQDDQNVLRSELDRLHGAVRAG
ncbi:hypothetical protein [Sphingomonas sp. 37zxx]|uniref:hypothetical protein n=1 Tax=Sphingomonas sp. 37zxx TaxID=1550073 RepID=UPI00068DFEF4|nr:hypothetical protein [Sphingomonas sp. 37zxx]